MFAACWWGFWFLICVNMPTIDLYIAIGCKMVETFMNSLVLICFQTLKWCEKAIFLPHFSSPRNQCWSPVMADIPNLSAWPTLLWRGREGGREYQRKHSGLIVYTADCWSTPKECSPMMPSFMGPCVHGTDLMAKVAGWSYQRPIKCCIIFPVVVGLRD